MRIMIRLVFSVPPSVQERFHENKPGGRQGDGTGELPFSRLLGGIRDLLDALRAGNHVPASSIEEMLSMAVLDTGPTDQIIRSRIL